MAGMYVYPYKKPTLQRSASLNYNDLADNKFKREVLVILALSWQIISGLSARQDCLIVT